LTYDLGGGSRTTCNKERLALAWLALAVFCLALGSVPMLRAQSAEHSGRKVIRSQKPDYPAILKNSRIGGTVRLNANVLANGTVANVQVLGGNPILAESAVKAVMKWKYAPGASASNEIVTFDFNDR
jgi:TonB family protein